LNFNEILELKKIVKAGKLSYRKGVLTEADYNNNAINKPFASVNVSGLNNASKYTASHRSLLHRAVSYCR
jgi:hypothetical protein